MAEIMRCFVCEKESVPDAPDMPFADMTAGVSLPLIRRDGNERPDKMFVCVHCVERVARILRLGDAMIDTFGPFVQGQGNTPGGIEMGSGSRGRR